MAENKPLPGKESLDVLGEIQAERVAKQGWSHTSASGVVVKPNAMKKTRRINQGFRTLRPVFLQTLGVNGIAHSVRAKAQLIGQMCAASLIIFVCTTGTTFAWSLFGPKNYDDCILKGMQGITSDRAAGAVVNACRNKFPDKSGNVGGLVHDCTMTYAGGKFVAGRPASPSNYATISFEGTTSTIHIPKSMLSDKSRESSVRVLFEQNERAIRKICPDIKILP